MFRRAALLSLAALAAAKEMPKDEFKAAELFDSGIRHENNKALKLVSMNPPFPVPGANGCAGNLGSTGSRWSLRIGPVR